MSRDMVVFQWTKEEIYQNFNNEVKVGKETPECEKCELL